MWCQGNFRFHRASNGRNVPDPLTGLEDALNVAHDMVLLLGRAACYITRTQRGQATPLLPTTQAHRGWLKRFTE